MERRSNSCKNSSFLSKKRKSEFQIDIEKEKDSEDSDKKCRSAESKKEKKVIYFIAEIDQNYSQEKMKDEERLTGKELNIEYRREKAAEILLSMEAGKDELEIINQSLDYDNTNKYTIYRLLKYFFNKKDKKSFNETINKYKFCITKKFVIFEGNEKIKVNLQDFYDINESIDEFEELPNHGVETEKIIDLRNSIVSLFTDYFYLASYIIYLSNLLSEADLKTILTVKINKETSLENKTNYSFDYENGEKEKILDTIKGKIDKLYEKKKIGKKINILDTIKNFLFKYLYIKDFDNFQNNQPISYKQNLTLYYNYVMYSIYELAIQLDDSGEKVIIKESKLFIYSTLNNFHNLLFDEFFDHGIAFNETMNQLLQYLLFLLGTDGSRNLSDIYNFIYFKSEDTTIDEDLLRKFISRLNKNYPALYAKNEDGKIIFEESPVEGKIEFTIQEYSKTLFEEKRKLINIFWENMLFEKFQEKNFFLENDIKYLKFLIRHILLSNLFKDIFNAFSQVSDVAEYYFIDEKNVDDYINRIIFLPFKVSNVGKYGITNRHLLSVLVSGFTEKDVKGINEYRIIRIMELALRVTTLTGHEPSHYIKAAYGIITGGKISRFTSKTDKNVDSGEFLEEVLFGWVKDINTPLDLSKLKLQKNIENKNIALKNKKIDFITALTLLNPDIYSYDLTYFRKMIFGVTRDDLKTFSSDKLNKDYKSYLNSVIDDKSIKKYWNNKFEINASKPAGDIYIEYISCNHNKTD